MKKIIALILLLVLPFSLISCDGLDFINGDDFNSEYVVEFINARVVSGKEAMDSFYKRTKEGVKLKIVFNTTITETGTTTSNYISFDGEYYETNFCINTNNSNVSKYKYLNYSETTGKNIVKSESYCLANSPHTTYEVVEKSWFSSVFQSIDAVPFYRYNYYVDLCFTNNQVINITYNDRKFPVNSFNKNTAVDLIDGLEWSKERPVCDRFTSMLSISINRTILNDENKLLLGNIDDVISVVYLFDFENKVAVMDYMFISSTLGQLYAKLDDDDINKINELFTIFQGASGTNTGEFIGYYGDKELIFKLDEDRTGEIYLSSLNIKEIIDTYSVRDGKLILYTNDGGNYYTFTCKGEQRHGYTYIRDESNPSSLFYYYFFEGAFFKWMGYPYN